MDTINRLDIDEQLKRQRTRRTVVGTGVKLAYAAPIVAGTFQLGARAASAAISPVVNEFCGKSTGTVFGDGDFDDPNGGCMDACQGGLTGSDCYAGHGDICDGNDPDPNNPLYGGQGPCQHFCAQGSGDLGLPGNECCNDGLCDTGNFVCETDNQGEKYVRYTGPTDGCG